MTSILAKPPPPPPLQCARTPLRQCHGRSLSNSLKVISAVGSLMSPVMLEVTSHLGLVCLSGEADTRRSNSLQHTKEQRSKDDNETQLQ